MEDEEVIKFIAGVQTHRYRLVFLIALFTGMRQGEVLGLSWDSVDWNNHILTIRQQLQVDRATRKYVIDSPKHGKRRSIMVAPAVMELFKEQLEMQNKQKACSATWNNEWNLVFTKDDGSNLSVTSVGNSYKRLVRKLDCKDRRFHDLRHPYVKHTTKNISCKSRNPKLPKY